MTILETEVSEEIGSFWVDGGVVGGGCGAVREGALDYTGVDGTGFGRGGEGGLEREGVGV